MIFYSRRNKGARRGSVRSREQWNVVVVVRPASGSLDRRLGRSDPRFVPPESLLGEQWNVGVVHGTSRTPPAHANEQGKVSKRLKTLENTRIYQQQCCKIDRCSYLNAAK